MRRLLLLALASSAAGCGAWQRVGSDNSGAPSPVNEIFNLPAYYARIGRIAAGDPFPFVGTIAFAAGRGDTTLAILGLSLQNANLGFQREGNGFVARYQVNLSFQRSDSAPPIRVSREETVRVASFTETQRSDESVLFQQTFLLTPGVYHAVITLRDPATGRGNSVNRTVSVPDFGRGSTTAPILAYQVQGRLRMSDTLSVVLNPRGTVGYGTDTLLAYVEGYDFPQPTAVPFELRDDRDSVIYSDSIRFRGGRPVEGQVLKFRPDSIELGALRLTVGRGTAERTTTALIVVSQAWIATNFDEILDLLRYFGHQRAVDSLRKASPGERVQLWRQFYKATDPNPVTPENEALDAYFSRVAYANEHFRDEGMPGWRTDRGEVFISLGPPDETYENPPGTTNGRILRWSYYSYRLDLYFVDETGLGRYRLSPGSRADFLQAVSRAQRNQ